MKQESHHHRGHRTGHARLFLAIAFVLQRMGDAVVIPFTFHPSCPSTLLRGVAIGSCLWTAALLVGVWRKLRWARYLLTAFNWGYMAVFTFAVIQQWTELTFALSDPFWAPAAGVVLYLGANVILIKSRRVRHFANE